MTPILDRMLLREVWALRGQVLTIALVVGAGIGVLVASVSTFLSLEAAQQGYYADSHFAEVFATVKRAPRPVLDRLRDVPGVMGVEGRISGAARVVDWPGATNPVSAQVMSLPADGRQPSLNRLQLASGRWPDPLHRDEALLQVAFAQAWNVRPGATIDLILYGRRQSFRIVGTAFSPEFIFAARPGDPLPDDRAFAVLWANEEAVSRAFDMEGAFNDVALTLAPGASEAAVLSAVDRLLLPYGGQGAYSRADQPSHRFLEDELRQQRTTAVLVPGIFLGIAAFLLNVVLGRLVQAQREQIAALKALGFPSRPIALHYAKFVAVVCTLGSVLGVAFGAWMGRGMLGSYEPFFRLPTIPFLMPLWVPALGIAVSLAAALGGTMLALFRVLRLPAAEGMRPPAPQAWSRWAIGRGMHWIGPQTKLVLRSLFGQPVRTAMAIIGIACAVPMVVLGLFWWDALSSMVALQFDGMERGDAVVVFTDPMPYRAVHELAGLPGVLATEGQRVVPVRLRAGPRSYRLGLTGLPDGAQLRVPRDSALHAVPMPADGMALSRRLAARLGVTAGSLIRIEVLEGERPVVDVPVAALVEDVMGFNALMPINAVNRLMRADDLISNVAVRVDPALADAVWAEIGQRPHVAAVSVKAAWLRAFDETVGNLVVVSALFLTGFGLIIAVGVVYNSARITLQERSREMASLRVLGFTRTEVSRLLFAALALQVLLALPLGVLLAQGFVELIVATNTNESFQLPAAVTPATFTLAGLVVLAAAIASALIVRRRVDQLDLVAVLKLQG